MRIEKDEHAHRSLATLDSSVQKTAAGENRMGHDWSKVNAVIEKMTGKPTPTREELSADKLIEQLKRETAEFIAERKARRAKQS